MINVIFGHYFSKIHYILHWNLVSAPIMNFKFSTGFKFTWFLNTVKFCIYYLFSLKLLLTTNFLFLVIITSKFKYTYFLECSPLPHSLIFYSWPCIKNSRRNPISLIIINNIPHLIWEGIKIQTWKIINWTKTNEVKNLQL